MTQTIFSKEEAGTIAELVIASYGRKPAMELIDLARTDKFFNRYGCTHIKDVFYIAQALHSKVGA
jgi:HD superfamily phosphodiesterase